MDAFRSERASPHHRSFVIVVVAAIYFATMGMSQVDWRIGVAIDGLLLGWFRERTGSLVAPFVCHAAFNGAFAWLQAAYS